jgi:hypothetical protein
LNVVNPKLLHAAASQGIWTVAFQNSMDALRFSHAAQMLLMYVHWPSSAREYCGAEIPSPDGRWLFMGPRVCMAIHQSADFFVSRAGCCMGGLGAVELALCKWQAVK